MVIPAVCFLSEESDWQTDIEKKDGNLQGHRCGRIRHLIAYRLFLLAENEPAADDSASRKPAGYFSIMKSGINWY